MKFAIQSINLWMSAWQFEFMEELINAEQIRLAELLRGGRFTVPVHQRYYDWEKTHVVTLLDDLAESVNKEIPCYFLGSIMLIERNEQYEINDGQQRMITYSLICAYLCKIFHEQGESVRENQALRVLFDIEEVHDETLEDAENFDPRITPPRNDEINFKSLICGRDVGRNGKLTSAWGDISIFFSRAEHQSLSWQKKFLKFMLEKIIVIRLEIDKSLDSNAIYESLNFRGKQLDQIDLIKNYFLSVFASEENSAQCDFVYEGFEKMHEVLKSSHVPEYVRCHMQIKYGFVKKEQFFRQTKTIFYGHKDRKNKAIFELVTELLNNEHLQAFKTFLRKSENEDFIQQLTKDAKKTPNQRKIKDYLLDLHEYSITRPIIFALFCRYISASSNKKQEAAKFVYSCSKLLASFVQRIAHVERSFKPSTYEEKFANLAKDIHRGDCKTAQVFFDRIKKCDNVGIIDDNQYMTILKSKVYSKSSIKKSRYVLKKIVEYQETGVAIVDDQVSVEHILPNSEEHHSKKYWAQRFNKNDCDRLVHCLGNLTLLSKKENSSTAKDNESFSAKKKIFKKSAYQLTRDICELSEWTPEKIEHRQSMLAKIMAKSIWNFRLS